MWLFPVTCPWLWTHRSAIPDNLHVRIFHYKLNHEKIQGCTKERMGNNEVIWHHIGINTSSTPVLSFSFFQGRKWQCDHTTFLSWPHGWMLSSGHLCLWWAGPATPLIPQAPHVPSTGGTTTRECDRNPHNYDGSCASAGASGTRWCVRYQLTCQVVQQLSAGSITLNTSKILSSVVMFFFLYSYLISYIILE